MQHHWDVEADVVVVGFGAAGMAAAVTAHDLGARVVLLEKAPEGQEGGNTRVAGQGYLNTSSVDKAVAYLTALCGPFTVPEAMVKVWAEEMGRNNAWLAGLGGDPQEHQHQPVGIEFPDLPGADCVHKFHDGPTYGYSYTWRLFERLVKQRPIEILYETPAKQLIRDGVGGEILGVRAQSRNGATSVKARRAVVLTCGGFENNQEMIRNYLPGVPYCYTSGSPYNEGDGITMAMSVGADLWHMNNYAGPSMALKVPEVRTTFSMQALHFSKQMPGGMIVVGPDARRFADEKFKTRHGKVPVNGRWLPLATPCPMFMVFDHTLFSSGPLYDKHPSHGWTQIIERYDWSEDNSAELAKGWIARAGSIGSLAIDGRARSQDAGRNGRPMEPLRRGKARRGVRPHADAVADRQRTVLCVRAVALDAEHAGWAAPQREGADRAPGRHADSQAVQRGRTRLDLQLPVSGYRQHRRMPGVRPRLRAQRRGGDAVGAGVIHPATVSGIVCCGRA